MRLSAIREATERALQEAGFKPGQFVWITQPNRLVVSVAGQVKIIALPGGLSAGKLERVLGRIEAWGDMHQVAPSAWNDRARQMMAAQVGASA